LTLVKLGPGGPLGSGRQGMSWIHEADMNRLFERALFDERMAGAYVASSPNPVSQREFMKLLRRAAGMPFGLPASEWMVRIGAPMFMRTDLGLALYGRYVVSRRLQEDGFQFNFPMLPGAVAELLNVKQPQHR
jgi:NAD dependent epimerase/dehydratase family enzyme